MLLQQRATLEGFVSRGPNSRFAPSKAAERELQMAVGLRWRLEDASIFHLLLQR